MKKFRVNLQKIKEFFSLHDCLFASLVYIFLLIIFFFPIIFQGRTLATTLFSGGVMPNGPYGYEGNHPPMFPVRDPGAFNWQDEPLSEYIGKIIKEEKRIPLWNPNMGLGFPILGGTQLGIFFPLNYIVFLFSSESAWDILILLRLFLAGLLTYLFVRKIRLEKTPAILAGAVFMFSGYFLGYINMAHLSIEALIPLVLLAYEYFLERKNTKTFIYCVLVNALVILPGMPEATFFALAFGAVWFLFSLFFLHKEIVGKGKYYSILFLIGFNVLSILFTAIQLLPFKELLGRSFNLHSETGVGMGYTPFYTVISLVFPYLFNPINNWAGPVNYIGLSPIILALLAVFSWKRFSDIKKKVVVFFSLFCLLGLAKVFGVSLINWIGLLPVLKTLIFPKYLIPEITFSIAILAAFGLSLFKNKISYLNSKLAVTFISVIGLTVYTFREMDLDFATRIKENDQIIRGIFDYFWIRSHLKLPQQLLDSLKASPSFYYDILMVLLGIIIFLVFWILLVNLNGKKRIASYLILVFVVLELFVYNLPLIKPQRYDSFKKPPFINYLKSDAEIYRIYSSNPLGQYSVLYPDISSVYKIQDVRFLLALAVRRYFNFLENVLGVPDSDIYTNRFTGDSDIKYSNRILDLMNVKYFVFEPDNNTNSFSQKILSEGTIVENKENVLLSQASLGGKKLVGFLFHAPAKIGFQLIVDDGNKKFTFNYGIADSGAEKSNGVRFILNYRCDGESKSVINDLVDPRGNAKYLNWQTANLDLSDCLGKKTVLDFESQDNGNNAYDHFFIGNFLTEKKDFAYDDGTVKIQNNHGYFPRTFIVHRAERILEPQKIYDRLNDPNFDIKKQIVVEGSLTDNQLSGNNSSIEDGSRATVSDYKDEQVKIDVSMENQGFLVLLDQYYPGWKAYVDGKETEIYPTDYVFRSVYLEKGNHKVEFIYDPLSYKVGKYISLGTILLLILAYIFRDKIDEKFFKRES